MANMTLISSVTVGSGGASSIDFTSIPSTYTDLVLEYSLRGNLSSRLTYVMVEFNGLATNQTGKLLAGDSASAYSASYSNIFTGATGSNATASTFGSGQIYIPNYASSNNKSLSIDYVGENNSTSADAWLFAGLWSSSAAINRITLYAADGGFSKTQTFNQYSTAYLYGVTNVTSSAKATGGTITSDGAYFYHTFLSSGTFTPTTALTAEVLCIAGGGGAANAGGGAGGVSYHSGKSLTVTGYTVTIGAGGTGAPVNNNTATNGSNSVFSDITSNGGGADAGGASRSGGSGSGAYTGSGGAATQGNTGGATGYGNAGGGPAANVGGSGGGSGAAGTASGVGGTGLNTWAYLASSTGTGVSGYYAGGGGTYNYGNSATTVGGAGGGGNGGGGNGTANTGGGAGAGLTGGNGGSGLVIVRYAV